MASSESSETRDKLKSPIWRKLPAMHEISASGLSAITLEKSRAYNPVIKPSVDKWERRWTAVDHWGLLTTPFGQTLSERVDLRWNALTLVAAEIFSCNDAEFGSERNLWLWSFLPLCNNCAWPRSAQISFSAITAIVTVRYRAWFHYLVNYHENG